MCACMWDTLSAVAKAARCVCSSDSHACLHPSAKVTRHIDCACQCLWACMQDSLFFPDSHNHQHLQKERARLGFIMENRKESATSHFLHLAEAGKSGGALEGHHSSAHQTGANQETPVHQTAQETICSSEPDPSELGDQANDAGPAAGPVVPWAERDSYCTSSRGKTELLGTLGTPSGRDAGAGDW